MQASPVHKPIGDASPLGSGRKFPESRQHPNVTWAQTSYPEAWQGDPRRSGDVVSRSSERRVVTLASPPPLNPHGACPTRRRTLLLAGTAGGPPGRCSDARATGWLFALFFIFFLLFLSLFLLLYFFSFRILYFFLLSFLSVLFNFLSCFLSVLYSFLHYLSFVFFMFSFFFYSVLFSKYLV